MKTAINRRWERKANVADTYRCPVEGDDKGEADVVICPAPRSIRKTKPRHFASDFCLSADALRGMTSAEILAVVNGKGGK